MQSSTQRESLSQLCEAVRSLDGPTEIVGGGTRRFLGHIPSGMGELSVAGYTGIESYVPEELVIKVKAGTPLVEIINVLAENGQYLPFDPAVFADNGTIGGAIATGMSGSRRPYTGSARDYVLGIGLIDGGGSYQAFGGQVMKNVAGYDVSRVQVGAMGVLGVIADVSLKVLPRPEAETSVQMMLDESDALGLFETLRRQGAPLSGAMYAGGSASLRFSGARAVVLKSVAALSSSHGAREVSGECWQEVDELRHSSQVGGTTLWRLSCAPGEAVCEQAFSMIDWGGAQRWLTETNTNPRQTYAGTGHWTLLRPGDETDVNVFHPVAPALMTVHRKLKQLFDPAGNLNPSRLYPGLGDFSPEHASGQE